MGEGKTFYKFMDGIFSDHFFCLREMRGFPGEGIFYKKPPKVMKSQGKVTKKL
jgi:hypothetical protein